MNYEFDRRQDSLNVVQAKKDIAAQKELIKQQKENTYPSCKHRALYNQRNYLHYSCHHFSKNDKNTLFIDMKQAIHI